MVLGFLFKDNFFGSSNLDGDGQNKSEYEIIVEFAEGDNLKLNLINGNINKVSKRTSTQSGELQEEQNQGWFSVFFSSSKDKTEEINEDEDWDSLLSKLEKLKLIRQATNNGEIDSLKTLSQNFDYSRNQNNFKTAVFNIDSIYSDDLSLVIRGEDDKVSLMNINQIASFLNNYQELLKLEINGNNVESLKKKQENIKNNLQLKPKEYLLSANKVRDSILNVIGKQIPEEESDQNDKSKAKSKKHGQKGEGTKKGNGEKANEKRSPEPENKQEESEPVNQDSTSYGDAKEKEFENEFWGLIEDKTQKKGSYDNLINKYPDISHKNKIRVFYEDELTTTKKFRGFEGKHKDLRKKDFSDLKNYKTIEKLKEILN